MYALTQRRNRLGVSRQRLIGVALAIGVVISVVLAPLSAGAAEETGSGSMVTPTEQLSDEGTASEAAQSRHQAEAEATKAERLARMRQAIAIANGYDADTIYTHSGDEVAREQTRLAQAQATADAYAHDGVYTFYDADSVLASAMPETTKHSVLRMIAPNVLLAILYGRLTSVFM